MTDNTPMPFGKYKGEKMANIPAYYLLWLLDSGKCTDEVKSYIVENKDVLHAEIKREQMARDN